MNTPDPVDLVAEVHFFAVSIDGHIQWIITRWMWEDVKILSLDGKINFHGPVCYLKQWCKVMGYNYCHKVEHIPLYLEWNECHTSDQSDETT